MTFVKPLTYIIGVGTANLKNAITVSIAAKALGVTRQRMYQIIDEKRLKTQKFSFKPYPILLDRDQIMGMVEKKKATKKRREKQHGGEPRHK